MMPYSGEGTPRDPSAALMRLHKAADQGIAESRRRLGNSCPEGRHVPKDCSRGLEWLRRAAEQWCSSAQFDTGRIHCAGEAVRQDYLEEARWLFQAVSRVDDSRVGLVQSEIFRSDDATIPSDHREAVAAIRVGRPMPGKFSSDCKPVTVRSSRDGSDRRWR